jgi:hypothetical protein
MISNEPANFSIAIGAKYARKYGSKPNNSSSSASGSHTSRILNKAKKPELPMDKVTNELEATFKDLADKNTRNYRIKIKRPKSAFFASASSNAISKPGNSPSPPPLSRHKEQANPATYVNHSINPYSYLKNSYKKNAGRHYFYTKEEMADYPERAELNHQLFMSKTCHNFVADSGSSASSGDSKSAKSPTLITKSTSLKQTSSQSKLSKPNRYNSTKTNFLFKQR